MAPASQATPSRPALTGWDRFWYDEASLVRLGAFRIVMMLTALYAVKQNQMGVFEHADDIELSYLSRRWDPIYAFQLLGIDPMGPVTARFVWTGLWVFVGMGVVGLWSRFSCAMVAALTFLWVGTSYSFGKPHHDCVALMFGLMALPLGPVGARLSVDSLLARVRRTKRGADPAWAPEKGPWAALPWRVTMITAALGYFFAGASKLVIGGPTWANGYTLQGIMLEYNSPWTATFTQSVFLCSLMSVGLLGVQAGFPLVFLGKALRWFFVPMGALFHILSWKTMSTGPFISLWFTLSSFIVLDRVPAFVEARVTKGPVVARALWAVVVFGLAVFVVDLYRMRFSPWWLLALVPLAAAIVLGFWRGGKLSVVYDGGCGICRTTMAVLKSLDWSRRLDLVDLHRWEEVRAVHEALDPDACVRDMHAVTAGGRVLVGYDAYRAIALRLPVLFWFAPVMALPGVSHVGRRVYRRVADNRATTSCAAPVGPGGKALGTPGR